MGRLFALAELIGGPAAHAARERLVGRFRTPLDRSDEDALSLAVVLSVAYPALAPSIDADLDDVAAVARAGTKAPRDARTYRRVALQLVGDVTDAESVRRGLRVFARREKMRIAIRELLPHTGSDVDVTSRELSDLADVCMSIALSEALTWADERFGLPTAASGGRVPLVVIGMGKLGGRELNAGSDIDLVLFYETDDGWVTKDGKVVETSLHEYFMRVAQRFIATLDEATGDGIVWRVDMRLRPEGNGGPLVNALAAAERYYETWGRTWERAALVRARPCAGDLDFGARLLGALAPFVWRRAVDPRIAGEMIALVRRARAEASDAAANDLKLGPGGIREAEFFVQSLQLIWGGRDPSVRSRNTLDALRKLRARGLVTDREGRELADAYLTLRRLEHRVQFATGLQTHALPSSADLLERIARSLGFAGARELRKDLDRVRRKVGTRLAALARGEPAEERPGLQRLFVGLDAHDEADVLAWVSVHFGSSASPDLARHLVALARRPDSPLGGSTRDKHPELAPVLLEALTDAADPEQAARFMAALFARLATPSVYASALAQDARATRRLAGLFGASAFLGETIVGHPELADRLLFGRGAPTPESAERAVVDEIKDAGEEVARDADIFVGALRRAKGRVMTEVGLADLAGELSTRGCTLSLSALADATLQEAVRFALRERDLRAGLAVIAMGKLGGREIGYGSDLDLFFVYEDGVEDAAERFVRIAQRVLRLVSMPHGDGPGYELDTRLRPSGNQGLLVVSKGAFAQYHASRKTEAADVGAARAEDWERQALLKARVCAGDETLGAEVMRIAYEAAYERGAPPPERVHHLRTRMERELAGERRKGPGPARFDLKLGRGGLVDVEFAVQWLQMKHGVDPRIRTTETETALGALEVCGYLDPSLAGALREGYHLLRRLEQRLRVLHGTSAQLLEEGALGLAPLARRMGMRDGPWGSAADALLVRYAAVTQDVRMAYLAVLGLPSE
jgi:glutamate-ammonia-ligase adenylyltransferase